MVAAPTLAVSGWLVDRFGIRRMLISGTLFGGLCVVSLFFASSYQLMFAILTVSGLGFGCIYPAAVKAIVIWFPKRERATAIGVNQTGTNLGGIIGASILPTIALTWGWRYGFLVLGLIILAICLYCIILYRDPHEKRLLVPGEDTKSYSTAKLPKPPNTNILKSRDIWMMSFASFFLAIAEYAVLNNLVLYLNEELLFSAVAAGGLLAMAQATGAFAKPISGLISDRMLGGRRKTAFLVMVGIMSALLLVMGTCTYTLGFLIYPVIFVLGMVAIGWGGLQATLTGELAGKEATGAASGMTAAILVTGIMVGPPLFGYIVDVTGSYQTAWLAMALSGVISLVFIAFIREHKKRI